jgi:SAM-dependent methyltransferase
MWHGPSVVSPDKVLAPERLVSMDLSAPFVYSTRRFFVPRSGAAIVHDMNLPLPLADEAFAAVFCGDAFHYVANRTGLAREFMRIIRADGVVVITHAHNRLQPNAYPGYAMSPAEYAALFEGYIVRVVPESYVLDAYLDNRPLDLTREFTTAELNQSAAVDIIAAGTPDVLRVLPPVRDRLIAASRNPQINPLYRLRRSAGGLVFERQIPAGLVDDFDAYPPILAPRVEMPYSRVAIDNGRYQFENSEELLAQHVLLDLPEDY